MSNALAIATVMGALNTRVQTLLNDAGLTGFEVNNGHPRATTGSGVYLSLYQLVPNAGLRNMDLPTRGTGGGWIRTRRDGSRRPFRRRPRERCRARRRRRRSA